MNLQPIFGTVRELLGRGFAQGEVDLLDAAIDRATCAGFASCMQTSGWSLGPTGEQLIRNWESCARRRADGRLEAYLEPGSAETAIRGRSAGPDIHKGLGSEAVR